MKGLGLILALSVPLIAASVALYDRVPMDLMTTRSVPTVTSTENPRPENVALGVYDPHAAFARDRFVDIEHIFIYWQALDLRAFRRQLAKTEKEHRTMMVTVEPYTRAANWRDGGEHLLPDVAAGGFDKEIKTICTELGGYRGQVLIRWGHEMERRSERYPWAGRKPQQYKTAFRHFVETCRHFAPEAAFVWSPIGEKNLADYYPGDRYVDVIGVSLWALQKMDTSVFGHARNFDQTFETKYDRVQGYRKPVLIAELGVSGDQAYRRFWFDSMFRAVADSSEFPELQAIIYFNDKEPYHWPMGLGSPDWRIAPGWFSAAKEEIKQSRTALR